MKVSPYTLQLNPISKIERTFAHWTGKQFSCSCGHSFDIETPEIPDLSVAECPLSSLDVLHSVTPNNAQVSIPMTFKRLGSAEQLMIQDYLNRQAELYVYGSGTPGKKDYKQPTMLAPVGGKPVTVSPTICQIASILSQAQFMADAERYTFEEFVSFMQADDICMQMIRVSIEVQDMSAEDPLAMAALG